MYPFDPCSLKDISEDKNKDMEYTYSYDETTLYLKENAGTHIYQYTFNGDKLTLTGQPGTTPEALVLTRDI